MLPPPAAIIGWCEQLGEVPHGRDVELHGGAEVVELLLLDRDLVADAGVVHQHVDVAEALHR
jgi:hypothetical protein